MIPNLLKHHEVQLTIDSAISPDVILQRGYRSVDAVEVKKYGFLGRQARAGLLFPIYPPDGSNSVYQLRPDNPRKNSKGKIIKYEWKVKTPLRLDVPKVCHPMIDDSSKPVVFCEGAKKADCLVTHLAQLGYCIVNLPGGVYGWRNVKGVLPDVDLIKWEGREVFILFDSDVMTKKEVQTAMQKLAKELNQRGATVLPVILPHNGNGKTGVDDFLADGHTVDELLSLMQSSEPIAVDDSNEPSTQDYINAMEKLGYKFKLNQVDDTCECNSGPLSDYQAAKILCEMRDIGFKAVSVIERAWMASAFDNAFHPIQDYLNSLRWDGKPHIDNLASYFTDEQATDNHPCPVFHLWLKVWLIGAVAKVLRPGLVQTPMLVLDGPQNLGKSYFVRYLCPLPKYHIESPIDTNDKDSKIRLINKLVWEVSELGATTRRADREALKAFISTQTVTIRKPYGRYDIVKPALASLVGTINNESGFLTDPTGNRRFLVVTLTGINWEYARLDVNQVWAEAVHLYRSGERWDLSADEVDLRDNINKGYEVENPVKLWLERYYDIDPKGAGFTATVEVVSFLQEKGMRGLTRAIQMEFGAVAKKLGLQPERQSGERGWYGLTIKPEFDKDLLQGDSA